MSALRPEGVAPHHGTQAPARPIDKLRDLWVSWQAGGTFLGVGLFLAVWLGVVAIIAIAILMVLIKSGAMAWVLIFVVAAAALGTWMHLTADPVAPPSAPLKQRQAGIHGDACYAPYDEVHARGLLHDDGDFSSSIYLGEYLDWFTPLDVAFHRTGLHVGYSGENNVLTVAAAGGGKFTTAIAQTQLLNMESMVVLDTKGQNFAVTALHRARMGHTVVAINPFNLFGDVLGNKPRAHFNPLARLDPQADTFTSHIDALAAALIVSEGKEPHFTNRARDLVACLMAHVASHPIERAAGLNTLPRVRQILGMPREKFAGYMLQALDNPLPRVRNIAGGFTDPESREIAGIISTAIGQLAFLDQPAVADFLSRSTFDFSELRTKPLTVYLMIGPNELNTYYRFARLIVQACLNALSVEPKPDDRRVLLLLDEQAQLKQMESITSAIALLRGYRVRIWSVFQDLNQLEDIYGKRWESFVSNAGIVQVFTTNDEKTARYFSSKAGNYTGISVSESTSSNAGASQGSSSGGVNRSSSSGSGTSTSRNLATVPLLTPQDMYGMPDWQGLLYVRGMRDVVPTWRSPYWEQSVFDGAALPDPYHDAAGFRSAFLAGCETAPPGSLFPIEQEAV